MLDGIVIIKTQYFRDENYQQRAKGKSQVWRWQAGVNPKIFLIILEHSIQKNTRAITVTLPPKYFATTDHV